MNRREFTASLAALAVVPVMPFAASIPAAAAPAVPPGAHAWAQLIARAQNKCSPKLLARHLHLKPDVARVLFNDMLRDGVLRPPGAGGIARAAKPFHGTGMERTFGNRLTTKAKELADTAINTQEQPPLVNPDKAGLGCTEIAPKDHRDASPDQSPQEIPERG